MLEIRHTTCHHGQPDPLLHSHGLRRRFHPSHAVQHPSGGKYVDDPILGEQGSHHSGTEIPYHRTPLGNIVVLTRLHAADLLGIADLAAQHPEADLMLDKTFVMYSDTDGIYMHDGECRLIEIPDAPTEHRGSALLSSEPVKCSTALKADAPLEYRLSEHCVNERVWIRVKSPDGSTEADIGIMVNHEGVSVDVFPAHDPDNDAESPVLESYAMWSDFTDAGEPRS